MSTATWLHWLGASKSRASNTSEPLVFRISVDRLVNGMPSYADLPLTVNRRVTFTQLLLTGGLPVMTPTCSCHLQARTDAAALTGRVDSRGIENDTQPAARPAGRLPDGLDWHRTRSRQ